MLRLVYSFLLSLVAPFFLYSLYKHKLGKPNVGKRWKEHFGATPPIDLRANETGHPLWIHAVSVGEVLAVSPLIKQLKQKQPSTPIVLTTTTSTGAEQAEKLGDLIHHRYMPLDFGFMLRRFIKKISPTQLFIMETELWPNTLHSAAKANIPITIINARLSERSCQRYAKVQPVFNLLASKLSKVLCQHQDDAERFIHLGLDKSKIEVTGSIKFDISVSHQDIDNGQVLRDVIGQRPVWIAASTHEGEDEQVLAAHKRLLQHIPDALMIIVPRHPERFQNVFKLIESEGFHVIKRTSQQAITPQTQVYLADTMGEMMTLLAASDVCFMGGSLLGDKVGGHNLLEPAALGVPTLTGPSFYNFTDITNQLINARATRVCESSQEITSNLTEWLKSSNAAKEMGLMGKSIVELNQGALRKTIDCITLSKLQD